MAIQSAAAGALTSGAVLVRDSRLVDLDPVTLYRILTLRSDVFVVEQNCPYPDADGRDLEPDARQLWVQDGDRVVATLRLLSDGPVARIGRVATARDARGQGLAARLMRRALELIGPGESVLEAQAHLHDWYAQFGYVRDGDDYDEDGILHTPMRRKAGP